METRVLLLRHAETEAPGFFHGAESDVGLGPLGLQQAAEAGRRLAAERPEALYSSPMRRALQTATAIGAACGRPVEIVEALHERRMGTLSGVPKAEGWDLYQAETARWRAGDLSFTHDGAESFAAVRDRAVPAFLDLTRRHEGRTVVVVAHGLTIRVLLTSLLDGYSSADFDALGIAFAVPNDLLFDGRRWRAEALAGPASS